jgi:hypothetical protein
MPRPPANHAGGAAVLHLPEDTELRGYAARGDRDYDPDGGRTSTALVGTPNLR